MDCMKCDIQKAHIQKIFHDPSAPNERYDSRCCWHLWQLWSDFTSPSATANLLSVRLCSACDGRTVPRCMRWNVRAVLWSVLVGKRMKAWWSSFPWFDLGTCNRVGSIMTKDLPSKNLTNILDCFIEHHGRIFISHWSLLCASKKKSHVFCWKKTTPQKYHGAKRPHHQGSEKCSPHHQTSAAWQSPSGTVDGWNPTSVDIVNIPIFSRYLPVFFLRHIQIGGW